MVKKTLESWFAEKIKEQGMTISNTAEDREQCRKLVAASIYDKKQLDDETNSLQLTNRPEAVVQQLSGNAVWFPLADHLPLNIIIIVIIIIVYRAPFTAKVKGSGALQYLYAYIKLRVNKKYLDCDQSNVLLACIILSCIILSASSLKWVTALPMRQRNRVLAKRRKSIIFTIKLILFLLSRNKQNAILFVLWAKVLNTTQIYFEMYPVYGDKCFTMRTVHFWCKKMVGGQKFA